MTKEMPLSAIVKELKKRGWKVSKSKLQYYKDLGIIHASSAFPESKQFNFNLEDIVRVLKRVKELQREGHTLANIGAKKMVH